MGEKRTGRSTKIYVIIKPIDPVPLYEHIGGVIETVIVSVEGGQGLEAEKVSSNLFMASSHVRDEVSNIN